jgi:dTDP-4-amino-4,6-dideoxygalactose transaminase
LDGTDAPARCKCDLIMEALERHAIEARPVWKPMHLQPLFAGAPYFPHRRANGRIRRRLFQAGVCLPSGSNLTPQNSSTASSCTLRRTPLAQWTRIGHATA